MRSILQEYREKLGCLICDRFHRKNCDKTNASQKTNFQDKMKFDRKITFRRKKMRQNSIWSQLLRQTL